jgi:predicted NBD/HSP70 family sugar kinase
VHKINRINITRVLQKIWFENGISRADLSRELGLVKSTVTNIVSQLLERKVVRTTSEGKSATPIGRKPSNLVINESYGCILGLEIQTESFTAVAIDLHGRILLSRSEPVSMDGSSIVPCFLEVRRRLEKPLSALKLPLIGIGVGLSGIIDSRRGVILQSNPLSVEQPVEFLREIAGHLRTPVLAENDANCCCWGELAFKKTKRHNNFLFVLGEFRKGETGSARYWGPAIGLGFVLRGEVYSGEESSAGEFQSILWEPGNEGQFSLTAEEARRIREDRSVLERFLRELCAHVALMVNTLNLTGVIFGGELCAYEGQIREILPGEIQRNWSYANDVNCTLEFSTLGEKVVAYGAAGMFLESLFSIPDLVESADRRRTSRVDVLLD